MAATESASPGPTSPADPTDIVPATSLPSPTPEPPGAGPWPPTLILTPLKEAGAQAAAVGKVGIQIPVGFTPGADGAFTSTDSQTGGVARIELTDIPSTGEPAVDQLAAAADPVRNAPVDIPNAVSAALGERIAQGVKTWTLAVVTSDDQLALLTFSAPPAAFDALLLFQSLCSVEVAA